MHNERIKYAATFLNNIGVVSFATGSVLPLFSTVSRVWIRLLIGIVLGIFFMFSAYWLLGHLRE
jgi:hypothetical protein